MDNIFHPLRTPVATNYVDELPEHILIFSDSESYRSSISSIEDDSALNEFIQDPNFNQLPILERRPSYQQYFTQTGSTDITNLQPVDIQSSHINYYAVEFLSCLFVSIAVSSSTLMLNILPNCADNSLSYYVLAKALRFFISGYVAYIFTTSDTYRSINTSIDFLSINWALYSYKCTAVCTYFGIQLAAAFLGALLSIGLHYNIISILDKEKLLDSIISVPHIYLLTPSYMFLSIFVHILTVVGLTFIMDSTNSLNCKRIVVKRITYMGVISLVYGPMVGPIGFMAMYKLGLYLATSVIFGIPGSATIVGTVLAHIAIKLLMYPFIAFHVKYVLKNAIQRYFEYR